MSETLSQKKESLPLGWAMTIQAGVDFISDVFIFARGSAEVPIFDIDFGSGSWEVTINDCPDGEGLFSLTPSIELSSQELVEDRMQFFLTPAQTETITASTLYYSAVFTDANGREIPYLKSVLNVEEIV